MNFLIGLIIYFLFSFQSLSQNLESIKLGIIVPLSGDLAYIGEDIRRGILYGIENASKKVKIIPIFEDNANDLKNTINAAHKLIDQDKVNIIITLWEGADVVAPISEKAKILHLSIRWNSNVTKDRPLTFTFESTYKSFARDQLLLLKSLGYKKIAIIQKSDVGWTVASEEEIRIAPEYGIEIVGHEEFTDSQSDFKPSIIKLLNKHPDILVLMSNPPATQIILKQLNQLSPGFKHTGYYGTITESDYSLIENSPYVDQFEFSKDFREMFKAKFGDNPKVRAAHAYEIIRIINWIFEHLDVKAPTSENLASILSTLKDFDSSLGKLSVNSTRNIEHPNIWKVYKNGKGFVVPVGEKLP